MNSPVWDPFRQALGVDVTTRLARGMVPSLLLLAGCHLIFPFDLRGTEPGGDLGDGGDLASDVRVAESGTDAPPVDQGVPPDSAIPPADVTPVVPDGPPPKPDTGPTPTCQAGSEVCVKSPRYGTFCILTCTATTGSNLQVICAGTLVAGCSCYVDGALTHFGALGAPAPGDECLTCSMAKAAYCEF
jgi:hypothetical protein